MSLIQPSVWDAVATIGTPFALAAFGLAAVLAVIQMHLAKRRREIEAAPHDRRVEMLATLEDAFPLRVDALPASNRFDLAQTVLRHREQRFQTSVRVSILFASLVTSVVLVALIVQPRREPQATPSTSGAPLPPSAGGNKGPRPPLLPAEAAATEDKPRVPATMGQAPERAISRNNELPVEAASQRAPTLRHDRRQMQPSAPTAQIDNITRITGDVGADGRAKQRIGLVDVVSASVRNETEIGGDVEAKGDSVQDVGVVKQ